MKKVRNIFISTLLFLSTPVNAVFAQTPSCPDPIGHPETCQITRPSNLPDKLTDFGQAFGTIVGAAILIAALLAFFYLIWGGISWITSGGDKSNLESARGRITNAIVGLIIVGAAWAIFAIIQSVFGFKSILGGA